MPRINLLPWREELRQRRKKEFLLAAVLAVVVGGGLTFGTKTFYRARIDNQEARNNVLRDEITELNRQIEEIEGFEAQRDRLIGRMEIIEELQTARPAAVHLMDELVEILPAGVYLTEISQRGTVVDMIGETQSNQRIATMMRNVEASAWLKNPELDRIVNQSTGDGEVRLRVEQVSMTDEEDSQ